MFLIYFDVVGRPVHHLIVDVFQQDGLRCVGSPVAVDMRRNVVNVVAAEFVKVRRIAPVGRKAVVHGNLVIMVHRGSPFLYRHVQVDESLIGHRGVPVVGIRIKDDLVRIARHQVGARIGCGSRQRGRMNVPGFQHPGVGRVVDQFFGHLSRRLVIGAVTEVHPDLGNAPFERHIDVLIGFRTVVEYRRDRLTVHQQIGLHRIGIQSLGNDRRFQLREGHRPCGGRTRIRHDINRIPGIFRECAPVLRNAVPGHSVDRHDALVMGAGVFSLFVDKYVEGRNLIFVQRLLSVFGRLRPPLYRQQDLKRQVIAVRGGAVRIFLARCGEEQDGQRKDRSYDML